MSDFDKKISEYTLITAITNALITEFVINDNGATKKINLKQVLNYILNGDISIDVPVGTIKALANGNVGIGESNPDVKLEITDTGVQFKISYDGSNYTTFQVNASGNITVFPSGGGANITGTLDATGEISAPSFDTTTP